MSCPDRPPILTITTLKNWVLPPRPKNARKQRAACEKKKPKQTPVKDVPKAAKADPSTLHEKYTRGTPAPPMARTLVKMLAPAPAAKLDLDSPHFLLSSIKLIDRENYHLKTKLLLLIHDYKSIKLLVMSSPEKQPGVSLRDTATTARKRVFNELHDPMNDLISNMNGLSYASPGAGVSPDDALEAELFDFLNLGSDDLLSINEGIEKEIDDEDVDDPDADMLLTSLSRLTSPSTSETDENLLMTSLTRSTTVSTTVSYTQMDKKPLYLKFYDLPLFSEDDYAFLFEKFDSQSKAMSIIEEDHYNQVADFLEEKLMSNDVKYYVEKDSQ